MAGKTLNSLPANAIPSNSFNQNLGNQAANQQMYMQPKTMGQPYPQAPYQQQVPQQAPQQPGYRPVQQQPYQAPRQVPQQPSYSAPAMNQPAPKVVSSATSDARDAASAASGFVNAMTAMVKGFALLSDEVIEKNFKMALGDGMSNADRTISFECVDYLMSNFAHIMMGLVLDSAFKDAFKEAIMLEMQLDTEKPDVVAKKRAAMKDKKDYASSGSIVIGVTSFMPTIETELMDKMQHSFDVLDPFAAEFDNEVANMSNERKVEFGFIFSNFMYLIRAFSQNDLFMSYVITVIERVKDSLGIKGQ